MKKIAVCGHFALGKNLLNGQTVKTKILSDELDRIFGKGNVKKIDTHGNVFKIIFSILKTVAAMFTCENVVILPAHNGLRVFVPVLSMFKGISKCKLHYAVVGGWLADYIKDKDKVKKGLFKFDGVYVETTAMKNALNEMGYNNIFIMPNCKNLNILKEDEIIYNTEKPYKLCTFSRVVKEKGIEDAVNAIKTVNEKYGETVYTLDIYGQVDADQTEWFENLKASFPEYVKYGGLVPFDKSTQVLKNYFALLFPTHYYTEGIPGTIIDAYAAGIPVISAKWQNFGDIVEEDVTGKGFEIDNYEEFEKLMFEISQNTEDLNALKVNCINKCREYIPDFALKALVDNL